MKIKNKCVYDFYDFIFTYNLHYIIFIARKMSFYNWIEKHILYCHLKISEDCIFSHSSKVFTFKIITAFCDICFSTLMSLPQVLATKNCLCHEARRCLIFCLAKTDAAGLVMVG